MLGGGNFAGKGKSGQVLRHLVPLASVCMLFASAWTIVAAGSDDCAAMGKKLVNIDAHPVENGADKDPLLQCSHANVHVNWLRTARRAAVPSGRKFLVVVSTSCDPSRNVTRKPWIMDPSRFYSVILVDYSTDKRCIDANDGQMLISPVFNVDAIFSAPAAYKYPGVASLLEACPALLAGHDLFLLADDDIALNTGPSLRGAVPLERLLLLALGGNYSVSQPALRYSRVSHTVTQHQVLPGGAAARDVGFVEIQAPVLTRAALASVLPHFTSVTHGWGLDTMWSVWEGPPSEGRLGVIDEVSMVHTRKLGEGGLYDALGGIRTAKADERRWLAERGLVLPTGVAADLKKNPRREGARVIDVRCYLEEDWVRRLIPQSRMALHKRWADGMHRAAVVDASLLGSFREAALAETRRRLRSRAKGPLTGELSREGYRRRERRP